MGHIFSTSAFPLPIFLYSEQFECVGSLYKPIQPKTCQNRNEVHSSPVASGTLIYKKKTPLSTSTTFLTLSTYRLKHRVAMNYTSTNTVPSQTTLTYLEVFIFFVVVLFNIWFFTSIFWLAEPSYQRRTAVKVARCSGYKVVDEETLLLGNKGNLTGQVS